MLDGSPAVTMPWLRRISTALPMHFATALPRAWSMIRSVVSEKIGTPAENIVPSLLIGLERLAERGKGDGMLRMGVDHAVDVGPCPHHLGVDVDLVVSRPFAGNLFTLDVDGDDVVRRHLLDADAAGLHQEAIGIVGSRAEIWPQT